MILVTGGTGLVGSHLLLDLTRSGTKVRAIYRSEKSLSKVKKVFSYTNSEEKANLLFQRIEWIQADIIDIPALEKVFEGITKVFHCAALISFDPSMDSKLRKINIEGTANIVNLCIKFEIKKLCFVSSIATLDHKPTKKIISEKSFWNKEKNHNMYAITKYGAEMEVWRASQEGVPVVIVNPGVIIGPGFWNQGSGQIFTRVEKGLKYFFPKITGFVGVFDVVKNMRALMDSSITNEQFILISQNVPFKRIFEVAAEALGKPAPSKVLKPWMLEIAWILEVISSLFSKKERKLNRNSSKTLFNDHLYSNDKIISHTGHQFEPIEKVVKETAYLYKKDLNE